jgi:WD40 repeat protein
MRRSVLSCGLLLLTKSLLFGVEPRVPAAALAFSPDGNTLLLGGHRQVHTYSVARGKRESAFVCEFPKISALAFSPDAGTLAVSGGTPGVGGGVIFLEWPNGKVVGRLTNHTDQATAVAFNPAGTMLASAGADRLVQVVNWPQETPAYRLDGHSGPVLAVAFSPDNALLLTASADRSIKVWDAATGQLRRSFSHHTDIVHCLAFRPARIDGGESSRFLCASGSQDKTVRVWQPVVGRMVRIVRGHEGPVLALAYSANGARLYSAGKEGIVRVIDADSDQILHSWTANDDWIYGLVISPDGQVLATGDWNGIVKLWDVREAVATLRQEIR